MITFISRLRSLALVLALLLAALWIPALAQAPCGTGLAQPVSGATTYFPISNTSTAGQSFTAPCSGRLNSLTFTYTSLATDFNAINTATGIDVFLRITILDANATTTLATLVTTAANSPAPNTSQTYDFSAANVLLTANAQYRFETQLTQITRFSYIALAAIDGNPYPGGVYYLNRNFPTTTNQDVFGWQVNIGAVATTPTLSTPTITNVKCNRGNDGTITATTSGGTEPYTYTLSSGGGPSNNTGAFTGLVAGTYTLTVTDADGKSDSKSGIQVSEPNSLPSLTTTTTNVKCNGGSDGTIFVSASGGTPGYLYFKDGESFGSSSTFTRLSAGTYAIKVKDSRNCETPAQSVTITQPAAITFTTSVTNVKCNGGEDGIIRVTASDGTGAYQYFVNGDPGNSNSFTGLKASNYSVKVKDANGCETLAQSVTVTQPDAITFTTMVTNVKCNGGEDGSIRVTASGGTTDGYPGYSYSDDGGENFDPPSTFNGRKAGTYAIKVKDSNGCVSPTQSVIITEPPVLSFTASSTNSKCNGGSDGTLTVSPNGGTGPYQYSRDNGNTYVSNQQLRVVGASNIDGFSFVGLKAGTYAVKVKDANGCETVAQSITVGEPAAIGFTTSVANVKCNGGSDGTITVTASGGTGSLQYSSNNGANYDGSPAFTGLSAGTYAIKVKDANNCESQAQSVTVGQPTPLSVSVSGNTTVTFGFGSNCTTLTANASGGTPGYTYVWTPGNLTGPTVNVCPQETTTYTVTATDANGCTATATQTVNVKDVRCGPKLDMVSICYYGVTQCVSEKIATRYLKLGATMGGCGGPKNNNKRIGAEEEANAPLQLTLKAFPNPVQDIMTLEVLAPRAGETTFEVLDLTGRARQTRREMLTEGLNEIEFRLGSLSTGIYLIRAVDAAGRQGVTKVSKQ